MSSVERLGYTVAEVARAVPCSRQQVYNWLASGLISSVKIGRSRRILHADLVAFLEAHRVGGDSA